MEKLNDEEPPLPPRRKYISVFRIDGEPILPPLMTMEKRRQMQKLREKALKVEQRIREGKHREDNENYVNNEDVISESSPSSQYNASGNISHRSQEYYESKLKESEESMLLLQNLIKRQKAGNSENLDETVNTSCNTSNHSKANESLEKLQKLRKSEILIYDNSTNEVIQVPPVNQSFVDHRKQLMEIEGKTNLNYVQPKKPSHLLLAGGDGKGITNIPSICLNPPTPIVYNKNMCDALSADESNDSINISEQPLDLVDAFSSDESMITHTDEKSTRNLRQSITKKTKAVDKTPLTPTKNVSAKIQQFEAISSDTNTPQTSPEKLYKPKKSCLGQTTGTMSRSATSPSIKLPTSNRSSSSRSQNLAQDSDNSPDNNLVRSSSFTLEGPSKALIDHMRQQKSISDGKNAEKSLLNSTRTIARKKISSPLRAHRDTVESKAKKVQKVELKSSKLKIQQRTSQSKLAQAAAASITPYNTTALTQHTNNLYKTKRSPYDTLKISHNTLQTVNKTSSIQMRKSNSISSNLAQSKTSKSRVSPASLHTSPSISSNLSRSPQTAKEPFTQMDKTQKEKFQRLLAQQEEEHRRLQHSFEMQQKLLIEQLNREMAATQYKSPTHKRQEPNQHLHQLSPQLKNQLKLTGLSSDTRSEKQTTTSADLKQHNQHQSQQSSPTVSNKSSYISIAKTQSQTANSHQSSYASHYTQSLQSIPLNTSHLSAIDHSNANTSLDISTLSTQTSPETLCATPTTQNSLKTTSSSRRRLFSTEINAVNGGAEKPLSSRSAASCSSYSSEQVQQQQQNKTCMVVSNNGSSRRLHY